MDFQNFIDILKASDNNAVVIRRYRVIHMNDEQHPINIVAQVKHVETGLEYTQILRLSPIDAQTLGNALLIHGTVADDHERPQF